MATLKKCLKLHKLVITESEGSQVLSSLANVSQRVPVLLSATGGNLSGNDDEYADVTSEVMGVLSYSSNTQALLLQKHFLALEKSRGFLMDILRDYQELLRHLRSFANDCVALVDDALIEGESAATVEDEMAAVTFPLLLQEWMETVLAMFEHEVLRKARLVADLEYSDTARLSAVAKHWSAKGSVGNIDQDYGAQFYLMVKKIYRANHRQKHCSANRFEAASSQTLANFAVWRFRIGRVEE
ncbi:unnamed protein product [Phytophthora fragariaefolia]|uniref:Unnamed protein product n=1 Tax=Phytophthora fragariaefolia TaxID=1490495 RepID=A0A9W7CW07_9STRA|nr:unnamed protein product [Phytophthora fragariaefolia]